MKWLTIAAALTPLFVACGEFAVTFDGVDAAGVDAAVADGGIGDAGSCIDRSFTGAFCAPADAGDSPVSCVRAESFGSAVVLPTGALAGEGYGGCNEPFSTRSGHVQLRATLPKIFRVSAKVEIAAGAEGLFVFGIGGDPPTRLSGTACDLMQPGDAVFMFWQSCNDAGTCSWQAKAGSDAQCTLPDSPGLDKLPVGAVAEVEIAVDASGVVAQLSVTPNGGAETFIRVPILGAALTPSARASFLFYSYNAAETQDRLVTVERFGLTCSSN